MGVVTTEEAALLVVSRPICGQAVTLCQYIAFRNFDYYLKTDINLGTNMLTH
jgi:hypothetical protein